MFREKERACQNSVSPSVHLLPLESIKKKWLKKGQTVILFEESQIVQESN